MAVYKQAFTLRLEPQLFDQIGILATSHNMSMNRLIESILTQYLAQFERQNGPVPAQFDEIINFSTAGRPKL